MESKIRMLFWLYKSKVNSKGFAPILLRITVDGLKTEISTGLSAKPKDWNNKRNTVKGKSAEATEINKALDIIRAKALKTYNELIQMEMPVTAEIIKLKMKGQEQEVKSLLQAIIYHNENLKSKIGIEATLATLSKYETLKKKVTAFIQYQFKRNDIFLKELNHKFVVDFELYLKTIEKITHNPTIKHIQFLKKIIHLSIANGWIDKNPFANFRCSLKDVERGYLTADELARIEAVTTSISRLEKLRDVFVFCCYTGLAYSDVHKLSSNHLLNGVDGKKWIVIHRTKTQTRSPIPLLPVALEILTKYSTNAELQKKDRLLPVLSNQKANSYLKELADISKVERNLTFHLARHTFATTVTLANGVPIETVSKMLGHTNLKTTQIYAKVVDTKISYDMEKLKERLA